MTGKSIPEAWTESATRAACASKADAPLTDAPECLSMNSADWQSLPPGYRREIERDLRRRGLIEDLCSQPPDKKSLADIRAEVEYAGRKRL